MRARKGTGVNGLLPIEWSDIDAYCRQILQLAPWEIEIVESLDNLWMALYYADRPKPKSANANEPVISAQPITPQLFDALFSSGAR